MTGHIIRNTGSAVTVQMPSGDQVEAKSVIEALDIVDQSRSLQQEGFGQINTLDFRTDAERDQSGLKISRIDVQARLGDEVLCGECWIELGGIDCRCLGADRSGQNGLPDQVEGARPQGAGEAAPGQRTAGSCSGECAACRCGGAEGEGE